MGVLQAAFSSYFVSLEKGKFVFQKSLSKTPLKPDRDSFCTPKTILFKIIARTKLLFSNYLGDYSYSFQGSSELITITVTVSLFFLQNGVTGNNSPQEFLKFSATTVTWFNGFRIRHVMISKRMVHPLLDHFQINFD